MVVKGVNIYNNVKVNSKKFNNHSGMEYGSEQQSERECDAFCFYIALYTIPRALFGD